MKELSQKNDFNQFQDQPVQEQQLMEKQNGLAIEEQKFENSLSQNQSNQELLEEIERDVKRTRREQNFFYKPVDPNVKLDIPNIKEKLSQEDQATLYQEMIEKNANIEKHSDILKTILFLYAKLNKAIKYVQGMNELLAPIYYCFASDKTSNFAHAEPDTFYCFQNLMSELRDSFCRSLDYSNVGIKSKVQQINQLLKKVDFET